MTETAPASHDRRQVAGVLLLLGAPMIVFAGWLVSDWIGGPGTFLAFLVLAAVLFIAAIVISRPWRRPVTPVVVDGATGVAYRDVRVEFGEDK